MRTQNTRYLLYVFFWVILRRLNFVCLHLPACEDGTECSETSAYEIQTPGNYPKEKTYNIQNTAKVWNQEYFTRYFCLILTKTWIFSTRIWKILLHQISYKSVQTGAELLHADRQTWRNFQSFFTVLRTLLRKWCPLHSWCLVRKAIVTELFLTKPALKTGYVLIVYISAGVEPLSYAACVLL